MKWLFSAMILSLALAGCSQSAAPLTPVPASPTAPTATLEKMDDQDTPTPAVSESPAGVFDVYLVKQDISPQEMMNADLTELQLDEPPLLTVDDIVAYSWDTHEMELTASAFERIAWLERTRLSMAGLPFVVYAGGEPIYGGALWTSYSSVPYGWIVIDVYPASSGQPLHIRLGYPSPEWFEGDDLRSDPRIQRSLQEAGKLK